MRTAVDVRLYVQLGRVNRSLAYIEVIIHVYLISYAGVWFGGGGRQGGQFPPPLAYFCPPLVFSRVQQRLYKSLGLSVRPSVGNAFAFLPITWKLMDRS